jgi:hypothetical protein
MTLRYRNENPLAEMVRSQQEEVKKYKWIESEKAGRDIGWERAAQEWAQKHFHNWKRSWRERDVRHPLAELIWAQQEEIEKYKWVESQKAGRDIGWERAAQEWAQKHFPEWKRHLLREAIRDALRAQNGLN